MFTCPNLKHLMNRAIFNAVNLIKQKDALMIAQNDALIMPNCAKAPCLAPLSPQILAGAL